MFNVQMFNAQCSTQACPRLHHARLLPSHRQMAPVVEVFDVANRPELGRRRAVVPRHVPDVHGHGTVGPHPLPLGLLVIGCVFVSVFSFPFLFDVCTHTHTERETESERARVGGKTYVYK